MTELTAQSLKDWLDTIEKDRHWLADELGVSKRTVDNWFTENKFPLFAEKHIARIRAAERSPKIRFSEDEWELIERARALSGYDSRDEFFTSVLTAHAEKVVSDHSKEDNS